MTLFRSWRRKRNFFAGVAVADIPLPAHDASLPGDTLSTVQLNYRWRRYISLALEIAFSYTFRDLTGTDLDDFQNAFDALMVDIDD